MINISLENTDIFVNLSHSKAAIRFKVGDDEYTIAISNILELQSGKRKGLTLTKMTREDNPENKGDVN